MVPRLLAVSISDSQKAVHSDHEGASIPELSEAPSFRIAGEERLLQEIVGQALVPLRESPGCTSRGSHDHLFTALSRKECDHALEVITAATR